MNAGTESFIDAGADPSSINAGAELFIGCMIAAKYSILSFHRVDLLHDRS